jgi:hypothetical protein
MSTQIFWLASRLTQSAGPLFLRQADAHLAILRPMRHQKIGLL